MRSVDEWVGKTDDSMPPPHVRLRIFEREKGVCHESGRKIGPADQWDLDHGVAIADGGENRESNLFPVLRDKHREKTAKENAARAIVRRKRSKHIGIRKQSSMPGSRDSKWKRKMDGTVVRRSA